MVLTIKLHCLVEYLNAGCSYKPVLKPSGQDSKIKLPGNMRGHIPKGRSMSLSETEMQYFRIGGFFCI